MQKPTFTAAEIRTLIEFHKEHRQPAAPDSAPAPAEQEPEPMQHYSFTYTDAPGATMPADGQTRYYELSPERYRMVTSAIQYIRTTAAAVAKFVAVGGPNAYAEIKKASEDLSGHAAILESAAIACEVPAPAPAPEPARFDPEPRPASSYPALAAMRQTIAQLINKPPDPEWRLIDLQTQQEEIERLIDMKRDEYAAGLTQATAGYQMALQTASQAAAVSAALLAEKDATINRQRHDVDTMRDLQYQIIKENAELTKALIAAGFGQAAPAPAEPRPVAGLPVMRAMSETLAALWRDAPAGPPDFIQKLSDLDNQREEIERLIGKFDLEYAASLQETAEAYEIIARKDAAIARLSAAPAEPVASTLTPEAWIASRQIAAILDRYSVTAEPDPDNAGAVAIFHDDGFLTLLSPAITPQDLDRILQLWTATAETQYQQGREVGADQAKTTIRRALGMED